MQNRNTLKTRLAVAAATLGGIVVLLGATSNAGSPVAGEIVLAPKMGDRLLSEPDLPGSLAIQNAAGRITVVVRETMAAPLLD